MDIIRHCAEKAVARARTLLLSKHLSDCQVEHFIVLTCSGAVRAYITYKQDYVFPMPVEPSVDAIMDRMDIASLAGRVKLNEAVTAWVIRETVPIIIDQLRRSLSGDYSSLNLVRSFPVMGNIPASKSR